ncbi:PucR family transcriptional regulator ligand-binding domain-containing protein [Streptomyces sp. SL13]|uniref:PucR family transcriptional regulator ligand-binding domain-containing protein n=1 Tax=Streptantibioticus silvisoli TaxID=2705255 RepID=A0AA90K1N1_9ACTN|nr:PucR family transcriptional regulator [Streptantibioticus silvisoli]MDI5973976.1 PucR family transcriptional regulator ligand-binding domain-containing protein [Streptantibioticus silvisoli]
MTMLTLRKFLQDSDLRIELAMSAGDLDAEILWTHVTELPDPQPYLGKGELVLTNGLWLEDCPPSEFTRRLVVSGAVGLLFGLRHSVADVPPDLVTACADSRLPLLVLPADVPFTAITQKVAETHAELRSARLVESIERRDALITAVSDGGGLRHLLRVLTAARNAPIALANRSGTLVEAVFPHLSPPDAALMSRMVRERPRESELVLSDGTVVSVLPVASRGEPDFTLLYGRKFSEITDVEREEIDQLIRFISIDLSRQRAVSSMRHQFANEVIDMVFAGAHRADELASRLRSFGIDPAAGIGVFAIARRGAAVAGNREIGEYARDFFVGRGLPAIAPDVKRETMAIIGLDGSERDLTGLAGHLLARLRALLGTQDVTVGVARPASGHLALRVGLLEAQEACRSARTRRGGGVALFTGSPSHQLLVRMLDDSTRLEFAQSVLGPIIEHDRDNHTDLERSLRAFFAHDGRLSRAASELHVHVNTLRNRLERVQELVGRDINRTEDRTDLFLALQMAGEL